MDFPGWAGGEVHFNQIKILIKINNNKKMFNCFQPTWEFRALDHAGEIYHSQNEDSSTDIPPEFTLKAKINFGKLFSKRASTQLMFLQVQSSSKSSSFSILQLTVVAKLHTRNEDPNESGHKQTCSRHLQTKLWNIQFCKPPGPLVRTPSPTAMIL